MNTLTRRQRKQVALYLHFKDRPMSIGALFWFNRRLYAFLVLAGLLSAALAYWLNDFVLLTIVAVAYGTMLLRDVGYYWRSQSIWPVLQQVLAWEKLQQLATSSSAAA